MRSLLFLLFLLFSSLITCGQDRILIAAASDLKFALDSVIIRFQTLHPGDVEITYGSSGKLTEQIMNGAPFHIFLSADISYPQQLKDKGKAGSDVFVYAKGRLVLWSKKFETASGLGVLANPAIRKVAIANPQHAPYGKRAMECLRYYQIDITDKLVYGENISQAAQFVATGAADAGILALSLALSPNLQRENGTYFLLPEDSHQPLIQGALITKEGKGSKLAASFFSYFKSDESQAILRHFGFTAP